jgi:putative FmdB family regulatory protein
MPIYDYRCNQCGRTTEILDRGVQESAYCCPYCGSNNFEKLISAAAVVVKSEARAPGHTCCGREERCQTPPCSTDQGCHKR